MHDDTTTDRPAAGQEPRECDVLVVGGGPAGSTAAALLARRGKHVVLMEKDRFPRFHIGESLLPLNLPLFERLGVAEDISRIGIYKPGAEVVSDAHAKTTTFRFADNPRLQAKHSYHVRRAEFDKLLLDNSRRLGATVLEGMRVSEVTFGDKGRVAVTALAADGGGASLWSPRFLVDASGRDTLLANRLELKRRDKHNNTAALFGHFRNVASRSGDAAGMITMHLFEHGWFWMIPLPDGITSVGMVGTQAFFKTRKGDVEGLFARAIASSPSVAARMAAAEPVGALIATANYSYHSRRITGDRYILAGDAYAFIDPLFSSGVMLAMSSAAFAADAVAAWLDDERRGERLLRDYERKARRGLDSFSWLIYRINRPLLRDIFMASIDLFDIRNGLLAILAGDFYDTPWLLSPLRRFQLAYGALYLLSKLGFRLHNAGLAWRPGGMGG